MRTGTSFSFSIITATARASTSLPPPGPVCTIMSTGRVGFQSADAAAQPRAHAATAAPANRARDIISFLRMMRSGFLVDHLEPDGVDLLDEPNQQQHRREREQHD